MEARSPFSMCLNCRRAAVGVTTTSDGDAARRAYQKGYEAGLLAKESVIARFQVACERQRQLTSQWQARYQVVKTENNALRRRLGKQEKRVKSSGGGDDHEERENP